MTTQSTTPGMPTVGVAGLREFLTLCIDADIGALIYGAPGVGKSEIVAQVADAKGMTMLDVRLAYRLPENVGSIYYPRDRDVVALRPALIAEIEAAHAATGKPVLVLLDEITLAPPDVRAASLEFLLSGSINGYRPACKIAIVAAGNRPDDTPAASYLEAPIRSRFASVLFSPSLRDLALHIEATIHAPWTRAVCEYLRSGDAAKAARDAQSSAADTCDPLYTPRSLYRALSAIAAMQAPADARRRQRRTGAQSPESPVAPLLTPAATLLLQSMVGTVFASRFVAGVELAATILPAASVLADPHAAPVHSNQEITLVQLSAIANHLAAATPTDLQSTLPAAYDYIDRLSPEVVRLWVASAPPQLLDVLASQVRGRRLIESCGVTVANAAGVKR